MPKTTKRTKTLITLVGLPCRGKSFLAKKLVIALTKEGYLTKDFNLGNYRRSLFPSKTKNSFFNFKNKKYRKIREEIAQTCLNDVFDWMRNKGEVAIFDGTNIINKRRSMILNQTRQKNIDNIFIELYIDNQPILNKMLELKLKKSPDYKNILKEKARHDFLKRIDHFKNAYEPLSSSDKFIRIINLGKKVEKNFTPQNYFEKNIYNYCIKSYKNLLTRIK